MVTSVDVDESCRDCKCCVSSDLAEASSASAKQARVSEAGASSHEEHLAFMVDKLRESFPLKIQMAASRRAQAVDQLEVNMHAGKAKIFVGSVDHDNVHIHAGKAHLFCRI